MFAFGLMVDAGVELRRWQGAALADYGYRLDDDGALVELRYAGPAGLDLRIDPPTIYATRPWHVTTSPCPLVPPLAGYVTVTPTWEPMTEHRELCLALLREGRGMIARLADDRAHAAVALRRFELALAIDKYGFDDGDALLSHDEGSPYARDVMARVDAAITAAGMAAMLGWACTSHNPVRQMGLLGADDRMRPTLWRDSALVEPTALQGHEVDIWAYDFAVLDDEAFWGG